MFSKFNKWDIYWALAIILLGMVAALVWAPFSSADGGFRVGQVVYATGTVAAVYDPCEDPDYRGRQFIASFGEALTITTHPTLGMFFRCGAYRVRNAAGTVGWVFTGDLGATPPKTALEKVNAAGSAFDDFKYANFNRVFAILNSDYFYLKSPYGVWGLLHWDGKSDPRPYWK